ncbi:DUF1844 domain-containing protein [candidate division WOR-3 bacterium]|nr:DUF1844 domain-containing protein [candidate division WOR-3 bacterium]MCK4575649.1 DUF1844 domain-containing protein [candidate division WOR-3 bacterium]
MFKKKNKEKENNKHQQLPEVSFSSLILMLATGVYANLGLVPDPLTKKTNKNLTLAQNTIELLDILKKKTKGNLTKEEEGFFMNIVSDLKMKFVELKKKEGK